MTGESDFSVPAKELITGVGIQLDPMQTMNIVNTTRYSIVLTKIRNQQKCCMIMINNLFDLMNSFNMNDVFCCLQTSGFGKSLSSRKSDCLQIFQECHNYVV